jgi:hypothetical protein
MDMGLIPGEPTSPAELGTFVGREVPRQVSLLLQ